MIAIDCGPQAEPSKHIQFLMFRTLQLARPRAIMFVCSALAAAQLI
jgi:hypothetical protein